MDEARKKLAQALETGFIDRSIVSRLADQPSFVVNDKMRNETILSYVERKLRSCDEFYIASSFLTAGGRVCLHNALKYFDEFGGGKGRVYVSDYLAFTQPEALRKMRIYKNIDTRLVCDSKFHGKGYLFKTKDQDGEECFDILIGSTNLTDKALQENDELNIHFPALRDSKIVHNFKELFDRKFDHALRLDDAVIESYEKTYNSRKYAELARRQQEQLDGFKPNQLQIEALTNLSSLRTGKQDRALVVSATGSGKTVLAAMDAQRFGAKRLLFVVHRSNIAKKAMKTFEIVFGNSRTMGLYTGERKDLNAEFLFATVQTINNDRHLSRFAQEHFDYIIIDETHRAGAATYQRVLDYFEPGFLLGMTATPERTDGYDIFSVFKHNIGYEIRLHKALEANLVCPFHYFGISDIEVDDQSLEDLSDFNKLVRKQRVDHIVGAIEEYGTDSGDVRGLVFCSKVEEAYELAKQFTELGLPSVALSGESTENARQQAIESIESDDKKRLKYIFTVDIFNEGIDIPRLNQVVLLRPTQSAIVFVQQLGRGLRKTEGKEYLTVLDFIGNYNNNYMIPVALFGDRSLNKDTLRKTMAMGSSIIPGASTVNFDEISKQMIFESISQSNLQKKADLIDDYKYLKAKLGRVPMMMDFFEYKARDAYQYVLCSGSLYSFARSLKGNEMLPNSPHEKLLCHLCRFVNNGVRGLESLLLLKLVEEKRIHTSQLVQECARQCDITVDIKTLKSILGCLNLMYHKKRKKVVRQIGEKNGYSIAKSEDGFIQLGDTLEDALISSTFRDYLVDSANYSLQTYRYKLSGSENVNGFVRYEKYTRIDAFQVLCWQSQPSYMPNVGGYKISEDQRDCALFVTYHKPEGVSASTRYNDRFLSPEIFSWITKNYRTLESEEVKTILGQAESGIRIPLFVKKSDDEGQAHYYIGDLTVIDGGFEEQKIANDKGKMIPVVNIKFSIDKPVDEKLYRYITEV